MGTHHTLINGTSYAIAGGTDLVNGTKYQIGGGSNAGQRDGIRH